VGNSGKDKGMLVYVNALREWTEINPDANKGTDKQVQSHRQRSFQAQDYAPPPRGCVYCSDASHKSVDCTQLKSSDERKKHLKDNKLCFNCTGSGHRADKCRSRGTCAKCNRKHHTSLCDQRGEETPAMTATQTGGKVCHPVVVVTVNGVKCRALLDTGSTSTYISGLLVDLLGIKPTETATRSIKTIVGLVTKRIETYDVKISDTGGSCVLPVCATKVDRKELLSLENPNYPDIIKKYPYLEGVLMEDTATKPRLPIHVILGVNEYTKIRMSGCQRAGEMGEPVAEQTRFGWTIMTTGAEAELQNMFLTQTAVEDYEELCRLDVLGIQDVHSGDQGVVHDEFVEKLQRSPEGWYETGLPWKGDHPPLANNKAGSLKRIDSLVRKLKRDCLLDAYDAVIQEQIKDGVVESAEEPAVGREFYIPHKPIVKETSETTKLRVAYDASARGSATGPSLNDCLDIGPPLQNQIWKVLVCARFHGVVVAGDIRKAFLQVRVVIQHHLNATREEHPDIVRDIEQGLYVDDLLLGGQTVQDARAAKDTATEIFGKAGFELHKWNSNARELELDQQGSDTDDSYAKQQLQLKSGECGLLGLKWDKDGDTVGVTFPKGPAAPTKRGILGKVAKVYDPLGLVSPVTLQGKLMYRDALQSMYGWLDSTVALYWITGVGEYKQFVGNRVRKIKEHEGVIWRHVPTSENAADLGSRGGPVNADNALRWTGPDWLANPSAWPADIVTTTNPETKAETKVIKEVFALAVEEANELDQLLSRTNLWRTLRVGAWMRRFVHNLRCQRVERLEGPLTTEEIDRQRMFWLTRVCSNVKLGWTSLRKRS
ncbi:hypothetical protein QZH41_012354, partial [Actinostola sp. cb2023]